MSPSWREIVGAMRADRTGPRMRGKDEFWDDFRHRARLRTRDSDVPAPRPGRRTTGWALALACSMLLLAALAVHLPKARAGNRSRIDSVEVVASHSAVLIMVDEPSRGAVLWVVDMETNGGSQEGV